MELYKIVNNQNLYSGERENIVGSESIEGDKISRKK